jgi:hypothetical protein
MVSLDGDPFNRSFVYGSQSRSYKYVLGRDLVVPPQAEATRENVRDVQSARAAFLLGVYSFANAGRRIDRRSFSSEVR